jgi:hypothetical protein
VLCFDPADASRGRVPVASAVASGPRGLVAARKVFGEAVAAACGAAHALLHPCFINKFLPFKIEEKGTARSTDVVAGLLLVAY